jgi:transposase
MLAAFSEVGWVCEEASRQSLCHGLGRRVNNLTKPFVLHRALTQGGIANLVVNPASIAVAANDKVKTDRRDSKKLARDLVDGRLQGIYIPTEAEELARLLPRTRAQLVEQRATLARQIKAKLHPCGLITPKGHRMISHRY